MQRILFAIVTIFALTAAALAQPLADRVPADALLYVGWSGSENLGSEYDGSRLKGVLAASDLPKLFDEFLPQLSERLGRENAEAAEATRFIGAVGGRMWRRPTAVYVGPIDFTDPRNPSPRVAILCDAGNEAAELRREVQTMIDRAGQTPIPLKVAADGNLVVVTIGDVTAPAAATDQNLGADASFKDAMAKVHSKPLFASYANLAAVVKMIDEAPARGRRGQQQKENWTKARDALGLAGAKTFAWSGAFDGKDWSTRAFLAAPAPRSGIFSMMDSAPVSDEILKLVPQNATMLAAGTFDPAKLIEGIRTAAARVDPNTTPKIDQGLDRFRTMTGLHLQKDVLEPLGEQWAAYSAPDLAGNYSFCMALINRLDDPAKAEASLVQLSRTITNFLSGMMANSGMTLAMRETTDGDLKIHYVGAPLVRPAWAVKNGVLYVALYPQIVSAAARNTGGKSILDNPEFVAVRKRLGDQQATSIQFVDLPRTAPLVYPTWMVLTSYAGFGDLFGVPAPPMMLPPLDKLLAQLAPAGAVSWVDEAGWHSSGVSPFPGSTLVGSDPTLSVATPALLTSILLPSLNRARETANRVQCAAHMRHIGQAILLYSNENKGQYPPDLGTLLKTQDVALDVFICPSSIDSIPPNIRTAPMDEQAQWVNDNSSYIYAGAGLNNTAAADTVVAYEKSDNHDEDGMNMLFGDGHVEFNSMPMAQELIKNAGRR